MLDYTKNLVSSVHIALDQASRETECPLRLAENGVRLLVTAVEKLKGHCLRTGFTSRSQEIEFFRNHKPQLTALLIYHNDVYNLEAGRPNGKESVKKHYKYQLKKIDDHHRTHLSFYQYYKSGSRHLDNQYFTRSRKEILLSLDASYFCADRRFSTSHDYLVAKMLANDMLRHYIEQRISSDAVAPARTLNWTAPKTSLVELLYAVHSLGVFNNGNATLNEIAGVLENTFTITLGQYHRIFLEIRARKTDRCRFLAQLQQALSDRMDKADAH